MGGVSSGVQDADIQGRRADTFGVRVAGLVDYDEVDARGVWQHVWRAVQCHTTQMSIYKNVASLTEDDQKVIWGTGEFYRVFSLVNGGRETEQDLFDGLR